MTLLPKPMLKCEPRLIIEVVSAFYNAAIKDVVGKRRLKSLVIPRHVSMYMIHEHAALTLSAIGRMFTSRDHTTVLHAIRTTRICAARDPQFASQIQWIEEEMVRRGMCSTPASEKREAQKAIENLQGLA